MPIPKSPTAPLAPIYDAITSPLEVAAVRRWRRRVFAHVPPEGQGIEIGAGTGANLPYHPAQAEVVTTELSYRMLRRAKPKGSASKRFVIADVQNLPFRAESFDWAVETLVFCEVPDPVRGLTELKRVLRPNGRLIMLEHVRPPGLLGRAADLVTVLTGPVLGEHFNREAEPFVRAAGFRIDHVEWVWRGVVKLLVARP